jgi:biopolymer transport protein ExbD
VARSSQQDVPRTDLQSRLTRIDPTRLERVALVRGDADVDFHCLGDVIALDHHAGAERVGGMTKDQRLADE